MKEYKRKWHNWKVIFTDNTFWELCTSGNYTKPEIRTKALDSRKDRADIKSIKRTEIK